jgi:hypothetical protein
LARIRVPNAASSAARLRDILHMPALPAVDATLPPWKKFAMTALGLLGDDPVAEITGAAARRHKGRSIASLVFERWRPAIMEWLPDYNWRKNLSKDVVAGITIGIVLIPQGLAYATLAGLPPVYGIYTGLPGVIYSLFGTSRHAAIGPMSIPALLLAAGINAMEPPPATPTDYIAAVMSATFLCGLLLLIMGWLNLGFIVRFISRPVLSGFASAASVLTVASVSKDLLGAAVPRSQVLQDYVVGIARALPATHLPTLAVGAVSLLLLYGLARWRATKRIPAPLSVVVIMLVAFAVIMTATKDSGDAAGDGACATRSGVALVGAIPSAFPTWAWPSLPVPLLIQLLPTAVSVTFVGFIESIAVAKMYSVKYGYEISPSAELKALGLTNMFAAITQSFPVMGAFGRSAVNDNTGAKSQVSGIVGTLTVILLLSFVMPTLFYLPKVRPRDSGAPAASCFPASCPCVFRLASSCRSCCCFSAAHCSSSLVVAEGLFLRCLPGSPHRFLLPSFRNKRRLCLPPSSSWPCRASSTSPRRASCGASTSGTSSRWWPRSWPRSFSACCRAS